MWLAALLMFNSKDGKLVFLACRGVTQSDIVKNERMLPPSGLSRWNLHEINSNRVEALKQFTSRLWITVIEGPASLHLVCIFMKIEHDMIPIIFNGLSIVPN